MGKSYTETFLKDINNLSMSENKKKYDFESTKRSNMDMSCIPSNVNRTQFVLAEEIWRKDYNYPEVKKKNKS